MCDTSALAAARLNETFATDKEPMKWVLVGIEFGGPKPKAFIHAKGDTPISEMQTHFSDDEIMYGLVKVFGVDKRGAVTSTRCKLVLFSCE
jgi:hypothetical protein